METVNEIMAAAGAGYLATTDGERPGVRPMGCPTWVGKELWFASALDSAKVREIKARDRVEFCIADTSWRFVRIAGSCSVSCDQAGLQLFWDRVPEVRRYFTGPEDPNYAVLRIRVDGIRLFTQAGGACIEVPLPD